jgi:hypothetical protein
VHLIVSVGEHSYLALPRGAVTPQHVLIAPIDCVPSRVHLAAAAKAEMIRFQDIVEKMFQKNGAVSLRFERALRTKGSRDHMQAHMIPLPVATTQLSKSFSIFLQKASAHQLKFHEIQVSCFSCVSCCDSAVKPKLVRVAGCLLIRYVSLIVLHFLN